MDTPKVAAPQRSRNGQDELAAILEIPNPRAHSQAILEHTRRLKAEAHTRIQAILLADGFTPRSLRPSNRLAAERLESTPAVALGLTLP